MAETPKIDPKDIPAEASGLDQALQTGNVSAINEYILAEAKKQGVDPSKPAKPRDEKGQFVSPDPEKASPASEADEDAKEADEPVIYEMTVEIAPGHAIKVQDSTEEGCRLKADLTTKAAEAAKNAIQPKEPAKAEPKKPALTQEEEYALGTKFTTGKGAEAVREYLKKDPSLIKEVLAEQGIDLDQVQKDLAEYRSDRQVNKTRSAVDQFLADHPEYNKESDRNRELMGAQMLKFAAQRGEKLESPTLENIEEAYEFCTTKGWLDPVEEAKDAPDTPEVPVTPVKKRAASSAPIGTGRGGTDTRKPTPKVEALSREQLAKMSETDMMAWYNAQMEQTTGQKAPY